MHTYSHIYIERDVIFHKITVTPSEGFNCYCYEGNLSLKYDYNSKNLLEISLTNN